MRSHFYTVLLLCFGWTSAHLHAQTETRLSIADVNAMVERGMACVHTNLKEADSLSNIVYYHSIALRNDSLIAKTHALMGYVSYYKGNYSMSREHYKKALESSYYQGKLERRQALLNNLGVDYEFEHRYAEANDAYLKSLRIARQLGDSLSLHESFINLGLLNALLSKFDEARAYLDPALSYFGRKADHRNSALCLRNLANLNLLQGNEEECMRYYSQALQEIRLIGSETDALETEVDFNWALLQFKRYSLVKDRQDRIRHLMGRGDISSGIIGTFHMIDGYYFLETQTNLPKAETAFEKAYRIFQDQKSIRQLIRLQEGRISLYARMGNMARHKTIVTEYARQLEEDYLANQSKELESLQNIHKLELQKLEIERLTSKGQADRRMKALLLALLLIIVIVLIIFVRGYALIERQKRKIKEKNIELTEILKLWKGNPSASNASPAEQAMEVKSDPSTDDPGQGIHADPLHSFEKEYNEQLFQRIQQQVVQQKLYLKPDLKIGDIAGTLGIHEREISKAINEVKNLRFTSYINQFRIRLAKEMLVQQPHDSIKVITFRAGFSSQPQFQRKFKELTGLTPEQFRLASSYQDRPS